MCPNLLWRVKRQPIKPASLKALHKARNYEGMVQRIKKAMNVEVKLRVGWVNSGGQNKDAPAWVQLPHNMPPYGSTAFKDLTITIFIRKSFLERSKYDQAAITVAHELSHIVLESINHPLRREEKAVDLTAMLLGFRKLSPLVPTRPSAMANNRLSHLGGGAGRQLHPCRQIRLSKAH